MPSRRFPSPPPRLEAPAPHAGVFRRGLTDEVAIDFPSSAAAIEFFRRDTPPDELAAATDAEVSISAWEAFRGARVPLEVRVRRTCEGCGGRGEVWSEPCAPCAGLGHALHAERLTVSVPAGVSHGDRFSFHLRPSRGPRTRVDVRVAVTA